MVVRGNGVDVAGVLFVEHDRSLYDFVGFRHSSMVLRVNTQFALCRGWGSGPVFPFTGAKLGKGCGADVV